MKSNLFFLVFLFSATSYSQVTKSSIDNKPVTIRINYLGLIDLMDGNFSVGGEYRFKPNWSGGLDAAVIIYSLYYPSYPVTSGFIARPFVRYYPDKDKNFFWDLELHYKKVQYSALDSANTSIYEKEAWGFHFKAGTILWFNSTIGLECYLGIGLRWKNQGKVNDNIDRNVNFRSGSLFNSLHYFGPVVPMSMRFLIKI